MSLWKRPSARNLPVIHKTQDLENLYVFGYSCKLFGDDEKAKFLDQGRHLIPWMGEASLMIDRYDGRGHLHDLKAYDSDSVSHQGVELSEEDAKIEALCEEERYMELHTDMVKKALYEEEELKRMHEAISDGYSAVAFNYDQSAAAHREQEQAFEDEEEEEPFYAPPELALPFDMLPPATVKLNAIIEKTAMFVCKQGAQMEIMIKTKQKDNPQFEFLDFGTALNPYYKHMVKLIKAGKYKAIAEQTTQQTSPDNKHGYLHPSLIKTESQPPVKEQTREEFINSVTSKLGSGQIANTSYAKLLSNLSKHKGRNSPQPQAPISSQKEVGPVPRVSSEPALGSISSQRMPPMPPPPQHPPSYTYHDTYDSVYGLPPVPGMEPVQLPAPPPGVNGQLPPPPPPRLMGPSIVDAGYDDSGPVHGPQVLPPPPDLLPVIDKMALYVAKNGPEFEIIVQRKKDKRFEFLDANHPHNPYYKHKKDIYLQELEAAKPKESADKNSSKNGTQNDEADDKVSQQNKSISFSLRSKEAGKQEVNTSLRPAALLMYDSTDDEDEGSDKEKGSTASESSYSMNASKDVSQSKKATLPVDVLEKKQAECRLKDKLAMAAQKKLAQTSKEGQIRAERKRKAAMFINMLKSSQPVGNVSGGQDPQTTDVQEGMSSGSPSPRLSRSQSPAQTISSAAPVTVVDLDSLDPDPLHIISISDSRESTPIRIIHSPSIPRSFRLSRSKSPLRRRSKSPKRRTRYKSRSPKRRRKRSKTPPSAYTVARRSVSPKRKRERSRSATPARYKRSHRSRSKDRAKPRTKKRSRSRNRNKSPMRSRNRSRSKSKNRSKKKSRSRSRTRKRSRSKTRKSSGSQSKSGKSKSKKAGSSRSPKKKKSDERRSKSKKSHKSTKSSDQDKSSDKKEMSPIEEVEAELPVTVNNNHHDNSGDSDSSESSSSSNDSVLSEAQKRTAVEDQSEEQISSQDMEEQVAVDSQDTALRDFHEQTQYSTVSDEQNSTQPETSSQKTTPDHIDMFAE